MKHFYQTIDGWFNFENIYREAVKKANKKAVFVEVGSWKGCSTSFLAVEIANSGKRIEFYAVDTWDAQNDPYYKDDPDVIHGKLYERFLKNTEPVQKLITPLRMTSSEAADLFVFEYVDFVFIDGTHTYDAVKADIAAWLPKMKVGGVIAGDDLKWEGVEDAVREAFGDDWERLNGGKHWRAVKRKSSSEFKNGVHFENIEGHTAWNISRQMYENRKPGLSAMVRLKNEAQFLEYSIASIIDWHDEICLFPQGIQRDRTLDICYHLASAHPDKVKVFPYPYESVVNGPGHHMQPRGSASERAYFYNWCMSKTTREFVNKWDGDMIAYDWLGKRVRDEMKSRDGVYFRGIDLAGPKLEFESRNRNTASELRVHRVTEEAFYYTHTHCEHLSIASFNKIENVTKIREHAFIHLKWCKSEMCDSTVGWPEDWESKHQYYSDIVENKKAQLPYLGDYPTAIKPYMEALN